jgi:amino acid adenylation domain-containing protein
LIAELLALGVTLRSDGERLRCSAPRGVLTDTRREQLARHKSEILRLLAENTPPDDRLRVVPVLRRNEFPLAVPQERIWFAHQLDPRSSAYTVAIAVRLVGEFSPVAHERAWDELVRRHEMLRATFAIVDGRVEQHVRAWQPVAIAQVDLEHLEEPEREAHALAAAVEEAERPFDLAAGPPFRVALLKLDPRRHILLVAAHHIVIDQWSVGVLSREFRELYQAFVDHVPPRLTPPALDYRDFACAHREWLSGARLHGQLAYWKRQLAGLVAHELPTDRPRVAFDEKHAARGTLVLPPELLDRLRVLAATQQATPFMALMGAFLVVLARYTGQDDLAVGTPIANRTTPEVEGIVGTFVNTLVFRTSLIGNPTYLELVRRVRAVALDAFANRDLSFERLVSELQPERDPRRSPFFQILFNVQNSPIDPLRLAGLEAEVLQLPRRSTQFELTISIDTEIERRISYAYSTALYDRETIDRLFENYRAVLDQVTRDPAVRLTDIEIPCAAERRLLLQTWNATNASYAAEDTVVRLFERQVVSRPDCVAVKCEDEEICYRELDRRASRLASLLKDRGAAPDAIVGICLSRSIDLVVALLAVLKAGAAYLPLDPSFPRQRLAFMLEDSGASIVITEERHRPLLPRVPTEVVVDRDAGVIAGAPELSAAPIASGRHLAYLLYTSGTTGRPKGVQIEHRSLTNFLLAMQVEPGLSADDRLLAVTTLSFDIAGLELYLPLVTGARVILATGEQATDPAAIGTLLERERITVMQATPSTWRMLLDNGWRGNQRLTILCGGEALSRDLADRLMSRAKVLWNMYGPTETTVWSTIERVGTTPSAHVSSSHTAGSQPPPLRAATALRCEDGPVAIGRPIANTTVYVLDPNLRPTPIGVPGELFIGGAGLARGYLARPDLTASRFVPDPFSANPGARMYRTGDLARFRRDGRLECLGRLDHQLKIRGHRIEPGEIEAVLTACPSISQAIVVGRPDPAGNPRLVGYFVRAPEAPAVDEGDLRRQLRERLPGYMVPDFLVELHELPATPNGKIDRAALPAPLGNLPHVVPAEGPASPIERTLVEIWSQILGVSPVGVHDDFFALGGHSLLAIQLMTRVEAVFNRKLGLAVLFQAPTIRDLARAIEERTCRAKWTSLVPIQTEGSAPPLFCVHGVGGEVLVYSALAARLAPDQPFVAIQASGWEAGSVPVQTIEAQAAFYIGEMLDYQPEGPYYIGGYSHGGRVALEMALRLKAMGREVAFLGIIDTTPFGVRYKSVRYLARALRNLPWWIWYDLRRTTWRANLSRVLRVLRSNRRRASDVPDILDVMNKDWMPERVRRMYQQDLDAFTRYRPSGRCGPVTVFRARAQALFGSHEPDLNWSAVSVGPVVVRHVAGDHASILREPEVRGLAHELRRALTVARRQAECGDRAPVGSPRSGAGSTAVFVEMNS